MTPDQRLAMIEAYIYQGRSLSIDEQRQLYRHIGQTRTKKYPTLKEGLKRNYARSYKKTISKCFLSALGLMRDFKCSILD